MPDSNTLKTWNTIDKSRWPSRGPWNSEPDKAQWIDAATGLPCLVVRNSSGALCGYVGIAEGHPLFGLGYGECTFGEKCPDRDPGDFGSAWCDHRPERRLKVHGGITFADFCADSSRTEWESFRARRSEWEREAAKYPRGDAARRLREWADTFDDYEAWVLRHQATAICHLPEPGQPERVWWFGFDCCHCDDVSPSYEGIDLGRPRAYRDLAYVQAEIAQLAAQLVAIGGTHA